MWRAASKDLPLGAVAPGGPALALRPAPLVAFSVQLGAGTAEPPAPSEEGIVLWEPGLAAPLFLAGPFQAVTAPAVAATGGGGAAVAWGAASAGAAAVEVALLSPGGAGTRVRLDPGGEPVGVALCPAERGGLWVAWEVAAAGRAAIRGARLLGSGAVAEGPSELTPEAGDHGSPALAWDGARAWLCWAGSRSGHRGRRQIRIRPLDRRGPGLALTGAGAGSVGPPALAAAAPGVLWAAWHTDRRPGRAPDLTRWVEVLRVRAGGRVERPRCAPPAARWGEGGEDQGLELPTLAALGLDRVVLLARSSHRLRRTDLGRQGWSAPEPVDPEGWGSRVRHAPACVAPDGRVFTAYRVRAEVVVEALPPPGPGWAGGYGPPLPARSCPAPRPRRSAPPMPRLAGHLVCFGDIHQHTACSDGTGTARESYERARDGYGDELVALTDHESFLGTRIGPGEWRGLMAECDRHDEPGRFVTLPGYEWTGPRHPGPGHKCVYLPRSDLPIIGREHPAGRTSRDLVASVGAMGGLVFPHHVGWTGADAEAHDPAVQTCWEVVSCHGAYEAMDEPAIGQRDVALEGHFVRDQLAAGLRFGLVGGSDGHGLLWHHGVSRIRDSHRTGLTAVLVEELTRAAVLEALRARRCYATSGGRTLLWLEVGGRPMGSELRATGPVEALCLAETASPIRRAELVRGSGPPIPLEPRGSSLAARVAVDSTAGFVYLRVEAEGADLAWSSPVWLSPVGRAF